MLTMGLRRPYLWVLTYLYVDILAPQKISWFLLASIPLSLIVFIAAFGGWLVADQKRGGVFTFRQVLIVFLLLYCGVTTMSADFPVDALSKWEWVWKALFFAAFLPLTLRTRLRIEAAALFMTLSAGAIIISAGIKTVLSGGGGYGALQSFIPDNSGLYEGSTLSMVAVAIIPLIFWHVKHGTVFPRNWMVKLFAAGLVFACFMVPVGTQTRTGLLCIGLLGLLTLRSVKRPVLFLALAGAALLISIPFLPDSYTKRMGTIENHEGDQSASTRIAVWKWTLDYAKDHPFGGGFDAFRGNKVRVEMRSADSAGGSTEVEVRDAVEQARAYHSAYFEMLGEQGWPGLFVWLLIQGLGIVQLEGVRRRLKGSPDLRDKSDRALADALQQGQLVYLFGAVFIGVAYQPFIYMLIGLQIALTTQVRRRLKPVAVPVSRTLAPPDGLSVAR
jgi:probable O-glycosylation ligase (exosortase A-associated)